MYFGSFMEERYFIMEEKREINRVDYHANSVIVVCDTQQSFQAEVENVSPLGMGVRVPADAPELLHQDIIIVAESPEQILLDILQCCTSDPNGRDHIAYIIVHQHRIGRIHSYVRT